MSSIKERHPIDGECNSDDDGNPTHSLRTARRFEINSVFHIPIAFPGCPRVDLGVTDRLTKIQFIAGRSPCLREFRRFGLRFSVGSTDQSSPRSFRFAVLVFRQPKIGEDLTAEGAGSR